MSRATRIAVRGFKPSEQGLKFVNRFPGVPLPKKLAKMIDTKNSTYGLCGGMCFTVIDHHRARLHVPDVGDVPERETSLYQYISDRQLASWGPMNSLVLKYMNYMTFSDERAEEESFSALKELQGILQSGKLQVLGLIYNDIRESLKVWDNHQVLAYGVTDYGDGTFRIHLYDPNYPKHDDITIRCETRQVGGGAQGVSCVQYKGDKKLKDIHGFFLVPYEYRKPPLNLDKLIAR